MGLISVSPILTLKSNLKGIYMPIYEYKCTCGATFETLQGFDEPKLKNAIKTFTNVVKKVNLQD